MNLLQELSVLTEGSAEDKADSFIQKIADRTGIAASQLKKIFCSASGKKFSYSVLKKLEDDGYDASGDWDENQKWFKKHGIAKSEFTAFHKLNESAQLDEAYFEDDSIEIDDDLNDFCVKSKIQIDKKGARGLVRFTGEKSKLQSMINQFWGDDAEDYAEQIKESASLREAKEYADGSADFESDIADLDKHLKNALKILNKAEWKDWIKATDENWSGKASPRSAEIKASVTKAIKDLDDLYDHMTDLGNN